MPRFVLLSRNRILSKQRPKTPPSTFYFSLSRSLALFLSLSRGIEVVDIVVLRPVSKLRENDGFSDISLSLSLLFLPFNSRLFFFFFGKCGMVRGIYTGKDLYMGFSFFFTFSDRLDGWVVGRKRGCRAFSRALAETFPRRG